MISTKKLRLWTIVCYAIILVGFGHGIITLGLMGLGAYFFLQQNLNFHLTAAFEYRLPAIALLSLLGQVLLVFSLFLKDPLWKIIFHMKALFLLWGAIVYFVYNAGNESPHFLASITALPFLICSIAALMGNTIKKAYRKSVSFIKK